jgi:hypothetical protein
VVLLAAAVASVLILAPEALPVAEVAAGAVVILAGVAAVEAGDLILVAGEAAVLAPVGAAEAEAGEADILAGVAAATTAGTQAGDNTATDQVGDTTTPHPGGGGWRTKRRLTHR